MVQSREHGFQSRESQDVILGEGVVMIRCLDIHTHHVAPQPSGVVAVTPEDFNPIDDQFYSLGVHPWATDNMINDSDDIGYSHFTVAVGISGSCGVCRHRGSQKCNDTN